MPRTATIGPAVYRRVTELTREGKNRTEAFQTVAQERSMNPGTVAANYYRTARTQAGTPTRSGRTRQAKAVAAAPARRTRARRAPTRRAPAADGDLSALANQIGDLVQQLVRQVEERGQKLRQILG
jgi:hypothetical protein